MLEAAVAVASRDGQASVTYRSVADAAGVAHSLVRHYFGSRHALLREALLLQSRRDIAALVDPDESLDGFLGHLESQVLDEEGRHDLTRLLIYDFILAGIRGEYEIEPIRDQHELSVEGITARLHDLGIPDPDGSLARLVIAVTDGLVLQHMMLSNPTHTSGILARLRDLLRLAAADAR
ncbi:TetR/AcrR family transcriptional regulator [Microbacterium sp. X-17]|uniref:TetR/AcrR family transcriptional regulator n=1 Tax=Microbacterium sp. X-17 TaxID=3144404 RepID=UPI0031F4B672